MGTKDMKSISFIKHFKEGKNMDNEHTRKASGRIARALGYNNDQLNFVGKIISLENDHNLVKVIQMDLRDPTSEGQEATLTICEPRTIHMKVELCRQACENPTTLTTRLRNGLCSLGLQPGKGYNLEEQGNCRYQLNIKDELTGLPQPLQVYVSFEPTPPHTHDTWE